MLDFSKILQLICKKNNGTEAHCANRVSRPIVCMFGFGVGTDLFLHLKLVNFTTLEIGNLQLKFTYNLHIKSKNKNY